MEKKLYPFRFIPVASKRPWGGHDLMDKLGKKFVECDEEGNEVKIRGKKNLKPYFEEHKDIWKKLYDKVYELISKKEDPHIIAFEEMLGIENVAEHFGVDVDKEEE